MAVSERAAVAFLAGFIGGVAVSSVVLWFARHRIRAWLATRRRR